jgi:cholesterol transport system auxiliary component
VTVAPVWLRAGLLAALMCAALAACSGLLHSNARPDQVYFLRATPSQGNPPGGVVKASLRLSPPNAAPGLESAQIVLVQPDRRMSFYLASRWPASTPNVVETLAIEKLRGSGLWQSVGDATSAFPADYVLQMTIRRFEADYGDAGGASAGGGHAPVVHVVLDCMLGRREGREVIATFLAEGAAPAAANKLSAVVAAFETAANAALDSLSAQAAQAVSQNAPMPVPSRNR